MKAEPAGNVGWICSHHNREPTTSYLDEQRRVRARSRALDQLRQLGYEVTLTPTEPAA